MTLLTRDRFYNFGEYAYIYSLLVAIDKHTTKTGILKYLNSPCIYLNLRKNNSHKDFKL